MSLYIGRFFHYSYRYERFGSSVFNTIGSLLLTILLIGFSYTVAINGFTTLKKSQVSEAQSIEKAFQYTLLLPPPEQQKAQTLLSQYLDARIHFFRDSSRLGGGSGTGRRRRFS